MPASGRRRTSSNRVRTTGYRRLGRLTTEDILEIHRGAASTGETWDFGIREAGSLHTLVERVRAMAREGRRPEEIASAALVFIVREHPFWDANHRTGFEMAQVILRAFGGRVRAPRREVERYVRAVDAEGLTEEEVAAWIRNRVKPLR